mmetsp:Transcript_5396/g.14220  ORF Transcript_5396/g.14220 Transcript_5396/m.14220 type:complete len:162 (-) Transcript_5396:361-846(-)
MAAIAQLTSEAVDQLRSLFDLFDADGDGLLEVEEVSAICASCGMDLTEAEVLDMVTELKPDLRKLPFEEFVNVMSRPMVDRPTLEKEVVDTFNTFSGGSSHITASTLEVAMAELGRPVEPLVAHEMLSEASKGGGEGKISKQEFAAMNGADMKRNAAVEVS